MEKYAIMLDELQHSWTTYWPISESSDSLDVLKRRVSLHRPRRVSRHKYDFVAVPGTAKEYRLVYSAGRMEPGSIWELV